MNITELDRYKLSDAVKFNARLNPKIWGKDEHLLPDVRIALLKIAEDFKEFLGISDLEVKDITVSGSNAAYTYTPNSDIDLHLVTDLPKADSSDVYRELFDAKKSQYNNQHNIKIGGYDVELYVQNANKPPISQGEYSLLNNKWLQVPRRQKSQVDDRSTRSKYSDLKARIKSAIKSNDFETIEALTKKIKSMRQSGLDQHGEFGPENLAFKMLRSQGWLEKLYDAKNAAKDQELSIEEQQPMPVKYGFKTSIAEQNVEVEPISDREKVSLKKIIGDFFSHMVDELDIKNPPTIKIHNDPKWTEQQGSFGRFTPETNTLELATSNRHVLDILRTMAHELVHCQQGERGDFPTWAGETGSPWEDEANAMAGRIMRGMAERHPEYFADIELTESSGYIPTKVQAQDPRFKMALTVDVHPGQTGKEANKLGLQTDRQGKPALLLKSANLQESRMPQPSQGPGKYRDLNEPLGPEFKPTMPRGTVRVDVSDVYDWYKLGKHISNLDRAAPSEFGKGPPSTIISFGDEDTEHKYIDNLEKLGLTTTDIDPVDPDQPRGMPRQKTDPTYNVAEAFDQPYTLTWERGESGVDAFTKLPDGTPLEINFSDEYDDEGNEITHVEFHRSHSQNVTGEGDAQRVFATVLAAIQQFIKDERPKRIMFGADKEPGASRAGLYSRLVDRFAKPLGYQVDTREAGTYVFFDLTRRFGLREVELAESLRQELELFEEQDLFEIKMTGKNLAKLAKDIGDVKVGLEFEMIVPDATVQDDGDMEPDYDQDERVRDIDDAVNFFDDGDYNGHRQIRDLRSAMQESYWEWRSEALDHEWYNGNGFEYFKEWLENNDPFDEEEAEEEARNQLQSEYGDELDVEEFEKMLFALVDEKRESYVQEQWDDQSGNFDDARQEYEDEHLDDYSEEDWLRDQGIRFASDVESSFGHVTWPYYTSTSSDGEADIERIALEFMNDSGLPYDSVAVSSSYHGRYKKWVGNGWVDIGSEKPDDCFAIEPDGSLEGNSSDDVGLEFVSPPIPLDQVGDVMSKVQQWAASNGVYTGKSNKTSMHTNISVPGYDLDNLDYLKAALLLGDEYVLRQFDRIGNTYAKPAISKIRELVRNKPEKAQELLDKMKSHLNAEASKLIHSGVTDKFTSINTKNNRIEFRSPGGDYLSDIADNPKKMQDTINRMVVAMDAAMDPSKYKEEYQKKLYKMLTGQTFGREAETGAKQEAKKDTNDLLNLFSRYAAGELPKAALKSFVRQAQTERKLAKGDMGGEKFWWNVKYNNQRMEVVAANKKEAKEVAAKEWGLTPAQADTITSSAITVLRPYTEPPAGSELERIERQAGVGRRSTSPQLQAQGQPIWAIVSKTNPNAVIQTVIGDRSSAVRQYGIWIDAETERNFVDYDLVPYTQELRDSSQAARSQPNIAEPTHNWAIKRRDGTVLHTFQADNYMQAFDYLQDYKQRNGLEDQDLTYGPYTPVRGEPGAGSGVSLNGRPSNPDGDFVVVDTNNDNKPVYRFQAADSGDAITVLRQWIAANPGTEWTYRYDPNKDLGQPGAAQPAQQNQGNWGIWIDGNNRFANQPGEYARGAEVPLMRFPSREAAESWLEQQRAARPNLRTDIDVREIAPRLLPGSTLDLQRQRAAQASPDIDYEIYNRQTGEVVDTAQLRNDNEAMIRLNDYRAHGPHRLNPEQAQRMFGIRRGPGVSNAEREPVANIDLFPEIEPAQQTGDNWSQDFERRMQQGGTINTATEPTTGSEVGQTYNPTGTGSFTGQWLVLNPNNQVIYRFGGIGNSQSDANRLAMAWLRQNPRQMVNGVSVVPEMG